ncbi:MAG: histidine phosphatase family protein [Alkalispirochaeta sp.]
MKYLTLIRHAKSDHTVPGTADRDRPLNERGRKDAPTMGSRLSSLFLQPDIVLASPAQRVRETLTGIAAGGAVTVSQVTEHHDALYLAEAEVLWDFAASALMEDDEVWLVAHNPGLTEMVEQLCGARLENVPTLGVVRIAFEEVIVESPNGTLVFYDTPKSR